MARGNQREIDRARAQARNEKNAKGGKNDHKASMTNAMSDAEKMREKQKIADLKKQGLWEEPKEEKTQFRSVYFSFQFGC